jgi:O-antigen/teichoic acid export membrane protein
VLALLFHVILIPQHGALGAAWATAVGHGCMAMGCFWGVLKKSGLKMELLKKGWRIGIFLSLLLAFLYWDPLVFELGLWVWFLMLGLSAVMLRLLDLRTFSLFLKKSA